MLHDVHCVSGEIDFHAHVFLSIGVKQKVWQKIGHERPPDWLDVLFRDSNDYGKKIRVSKNWHIWKINGPFEAIGELTQQYQHAEIGVVLPPKIVASRMRNGKYNFPYPEY